MPWDVFRLTMSELNLLSITRGEIRQAEYEDRICDLHMGASLNTFAYHDHKKMPKLKSLLPKKPAIILQEEEDAKAMKEEFAHIGLRVPV